MFIYRSIFGKFQKSTDRGDFLKILKMFTNRSIFENIDIFLKWENMIHKKSHIVSGDPRKTKNMCYFKIREKFCNLTIKANFI